MKTLMLASIASMIYHFNMSNIEMLLDMGCHMDVACNFLVGNACSEEKIDELKNRLKKLGVRYYQIDFSRNVTKINRIVIAYKQVKKLMKQNKYDFVHCHTPIGGVIARLAGKATNTKVIYTAHGFHFYKGAPLVNWLVYYPIEWLCSWFTDTIITINQEDYNRAKKHLHAKHTEYIHGVGVSSDRYNTLPLNENFKTKLGYDESDFLILCTGELNKNKNQQELIKAIAKINKPNIKVMLAGNGSNLDNLKSLSAELKVEDRVNFVGYRTDLEKFVKISDLVVSMSIREGLGLNLIEAMLCAKPIVAADNRGHRDLIVNGSGGYLVGIHDADTLAKRINELYENPILREKMGSFNAERAKSFLSEISISEMKEIYGGIIDE